MSCLKDGKRGTPVPPIHNRTWRDRGIFKKGNMLITKLIHRWALWVMRRRPPDFINGRDYLSKGHHYLSRWWVIPTTRMFNIFLHKMEASDDDRALHDHPWRNCSYILSGSYIEIMPDRNRVLRAGDIVFRRATAAHRLVVSQGPVVTLFFTGPKIREWGFLCPQGWRHWKQFSAPWDQGEVGRGCD